MLNSVQKKQGLSLKQGRIFAGLAFLLPSLVICFIFVVIPLIDVIKYSFTDWNGVSKKYNFVGLSNYRALGQMEGAKDMAIATVVFAIGVTILTIVISFIVALQLDKKGRGRVNRSLLRTFWYFPALLSGAIVGILWHIMYNYNNGVLNTILKNAGLKKVNWLETVGVANVAVIVGQVWVMLGMCIVIFLAGLQSIPQELFEAAALDGASPGQQLRHITLPMMASSITINVITTTIAAFKAYELPYLISNGQPGYSTLLITQRVYFLGFTSSDYGRGSALSVILLLIITLISIIQLLSLRKNEERNE